MIDKSRFAARAARHTLTLLALTVALSPFVRAQESNQYDRGTPPQHAAGINSFGSYVSADLGNINLSNGSLNFSLSLGQVGGRGFSLPLSLNYSSKVWSASTGTEFVNEPIARQYKTSYAVYDADEASPGLYQRLAPGWTLGVVPTLRARGVGISAANNSSCGSEDFLKALTKLTVMLPDKGEVELRDDNTDGSPLGATGSPCRNMDGNRGQHWHAADGSGIVFISDAANGIVNGNLAGWLITSDGTRYRFDDTASGFAGSVYLNEMARASSVTDRNGNRVLISYSTNPLSVTYTDQLGRAGTVEYGVTDSLTGEQLAARVTLLGYGGQPLQYKLKTGLMNQNYRAGISPALPVYNGWVPGMAGDETCGNAPTGATQLFSGWCGGAERLDDRQVLTQLVLPDGRSLRFRYNEYGEVAEAEMPTGGRVQYDYAYEDGLPTGFSPQFEVNASPGPGNVYNIDRAVKARRTLPDGVNVEGNWTYEYTSTRGADGAASNGMTEVIARAADNSTVLSRSRHYFMDAARFQTSTGGTGYSLWSTGLERRSETLNAAGTAVIAAGEEDWAQRAPVNWTTGYTSEQIANDNRVNESRKFLDDGKVARSTYLYDQFNNPTETGEYDYDNTLKRRTVTTYSATNFVGGMNYAADPVRLLRLPLQQSVYDGAGAEQARTTYEYDAYPADGDHAALESYAGFTVTGHDTAGYGMTYSTRGNPTRLGRWIKSSNSYVYSYTRYDILGNVVSAKDPNGKVSFISYADDFGSGANPGGGTGGANGPTFAYPTLLTSPPPNDGEQAHTARSQYDFSTGLPTGFRDRNNVVTQAIYDQFNRPTLVKSALGVQGVEAHTAMYYAPATVFGVTLAKNDVLTAKDLNTLDSGTIRSWTRTDGFGRTVEAWSRDPQGDVQVVTAYDALGRAAKVSYPLRPSQGQTPQYTTSEYDLAGRVTKVTTPDTAAVTTSYVGNQVTVTDQASRTRRSVTDALGRLIRVDEPDATSGNLDDANGNPVQSTAYTYDVLGNLRKVDQGGQLRFFAYDSLSRLIRAKNPEQGNMATDADFPALTDSTASPGNNQWSAAYIYDGNGNLTKRKDARNITATYVYDALNRNKSIDYSDSTPDVTRAYDGATLGKGRLWKSESSVSTLTVIDQYDEAGRPKQQTQKFWTGGAWGQGYTTQLNYNTADAVTSETYPSGHTVSYNYDVAGRLADNGAQPAFSGNLGDGAQRTYSSEIRYHAVGGQEQERFGTNTPVYNKHLYNSRGQLAEIRVSTYSLTTAGHETDWNRGAIINQYSNAAGVWGATGGGPDNNGNLLKQEIFIPNDDAISGYVLSTSFYDYDALNRLLRVREARNSADQWAQAYDYDRWGNRTINAAGTQVYGQNPGYSIPEPQFSVDPATNRLGVPTGQAGEMSYDYAGNLTKDTYQGGNGGGGTRAYDAENRMTSAQFVAGQLQTATYTYDADGRRVKRSMGAGGEVWQVYGVGGELLAEYAPNAAASSPRKEYGYRGGELLVTAEAGTGGAQAGATVANAFVTGMSLGTLRADSPGWAGMRITTGAQPVTVSSLGRLCNSGNSLSHDLKMVRASDNATVATATISMSGCTVNQFKYAPLQSPVTLAANTDYYVVSYEVGSDTFHDWTGTWLTTTSVAAVTAAVYTPDGGQTWGTPTGSGNSYVPVGFEYTTPAPQALVTGMSLGSLRADSPGWTGTKLSVGAQPLTVTFLGRLCSPGNSLSHDLKVVRVSDNQTVASVTVGMSGCTAGEFKYALLASPVTLSANTSYYVVSYEAGGDLFRDWTGTWLTTTSVATLTAAVYTPDGGQTWGEPTGAGNSYGPVDIKYLPVGTTADVRWMVADQLGTPRMVVDKSGSLAGVTRHDYLPFGEELTAGVGGRTTNQGYVGDNLRQGFVGYEKDGETGLNFAQARYYASTQGRFTSVDPALSSGKPAEPQSWNRYTYVLNNPLLYTDPTGLIWGYKEMEEDGHKFRRFQWFDSDKVGEGYTAYNSSHFVGSDEVLWLSSNSSDYLRVSKDRFSADEFASLRSAQGADSTSFSPEQLNVVNRGIADTVGSSGLYALEKAVAAGAGGLAGGLGSGLNFTFGAASRQAARLPPVLFHFTDEAGAAAIEASQLGRTNRFLFLTNNGGLTPLQAQLELSLPAQNAPRALFAVDSQALSTSNLLRSGRVTGNVFGRPGGGFEFQFSKGTTVPQGSFTRFRF